jgi:NADP-dependent 3-hydroxy acid dehydrogenase YdfG
VTGSSTGMGLEMTKIILSKGEKVVATSPFENPEELTSLEKQYGKKQILILTLDVTNRQQIDSAFQKARNYFGRIDVVHNNAGVSGPVGELEMVDEKHARQTFEVIYSAAQNHSNRTR